MKRAALKCLRLEELPTPEAWPGHVVVDVKACGVNYPDALIIRDMYQFKPPRPFSPGGEISGDFGGRRGRDRFSRATASLRPAAGAAWRSRWRSTPPAQ